MGALDKRIEQGLADPISDKEKQLVTKLRKSFEQKFDNPVDIDFFYEHDFGNPDPVIVSCYRPAISIPVDQIEAKIQAIIIEALEIDKDIEDEDSAVWYTTAVCNYPAIISKALMNQLFVTGTLQE